MELRTLLGMMRNRLKMARSNGETKAGCCRQAFAVVMNRQCSLLLEMETLRSLKSLVLRSLVLYGALYHLYF